MRDRLAVIQALRQFEPVEERAWDVVKAITGEYPDEIEWPDNLAADDAEFTVRYTATVLGNPSNESARIPLRYLWEKMPGEEDAG